MTNQTEQVREMREAVDAVTRYTTRGCAGAACDLARGAWMGNQLTAIGRAAAATPLEVRSTFGDIPWELLVGLGDERHGVSAMTADEMQRFVQQVLPAVRKALHARK